MKNTNKVSEEIKKKYDYLKKTHPGKKIIYFFVEDTFDGERFDYFVVRPSKIVMDAYRKDAEDDEDIAYKNLAREIIVEGDLALLKGEDNSLYEGLSTAILDIIGQVKHQLVKI